MLHNFDWKNVATGYGVRINSKIKWIGYRTLRFCFSYAPAMHFYARQNGYWFTQRCEKEFLLGSKVQGCVLRVACYSLQVAGCLSTSLRVVSPSTVLRTVSLSNGLPNHGVRVAK